MGDLGMLQAFLRTATDGWGLALASVRDLFVEGDLHPEEVGGDFAAESERLGEAVAGVHHELARLFPTGSEPTGAALATAMQSRLDDAVRAAPELVEMQAGLTALFDRLAGVHCASRDPARAWRPAPRPDPAHREGLEAHRLRRRAGEEPRGALAPVLAVA